MSLNVGFAIIGVGIFAVLLGVLVRIHNYKYGTKLQTGLILKDSLTFLWKRSLKIARKEWNSRHNS